MRKIFIIFGIILLTSGVLGVVWYLWQNYTESGSALSQASRDSTFPIYKPTNLPKGFTINNSSMSLTSQALLFSAQATDGDNKLIFTQTPVPAEYDFESFYKTRLVGVQDVPSLYGRGIVGIMDDAMSGSLVTSSTWILVKGPEKMPANDMKSVVAGLKPIQK